MRLLKLDIIGCKQEGEQQKVLTEITNGSDKKMGTITKLWFRKL
jgi:hypothetical protein